MHRGTKKAARGLDAARCARIARRVITLLFPRRKRIPSVDVALLSNVVLRRLKWRFLHQRASVVDVLAFPHSASFPDPEMNMMIGEVYVNRDIARHDPHYAQYLLIHGILHLAGFRHDRNRDTMVMERMEDRLCRRVTGISREAIRAHFGGRSISQHGIASSSRTRHRHGIG